MRVNYIILLFSMLFLAISCEKGKPEPENTSKTNFIIGDKSYTSTRTNLYVTDFGKIVEAYGDDFQLYIVLSDTSNTSFLITDTLQADKEEAARCVLKIADAYHFSTNGTIDLGADNKAGNMEISFGSIIIDKGKLYIDSVIYRPYIDFTKISSTDLQGFPINTGDENDWRIRNDFQILERLIFNENSEFFFKDLKLIGYPNPLRTIFGLEVDINQDEYIDLYLVNENFEIEFKLIQSQKEHFAFALHNPNYKGNYYRFYYKIYKDYEKFYGSGDLKVVE